MLGVKCSLAKGDGGGVRASANSRGDPRGEPGTLAGWKAGRVLEMKKGELPEGRWHREKKRRERRRSWAAPAG